MTHILIVEDERIVARELQHTLAKMGYEISGVASSSTQAIASASDRSPDLVLMDIRIEGDRDGIATAALMRERFHVPVVYLTAFADQATVERASGTEAYGYLLKPFSDTQLRSAIEVALQKHRGDVQARERERWFSTTLRAIGDAVIAADASGRVQFMNRAAETLTGLPAEQAAGQQLSDVFHIIDERTRKDAFAAADATEMWNVGKVLHLPANSALVAADGTNVPIDTSVASIVDDAGNALGAVTVFRDITEQRLLQEQLAIADRLSALGILAAGVAHEINNPLTGIALYADDAASELRAITLQIADGGGISDVEPRLREMATGVGHIQQAAERIARIVSDLKMFSRPGRDADEVFDVRHALEWAARVALKDIDEGMRLITTLEPVPHVNGSQAKLAQVFVNLLMNAAQSFTPGSSSGNEIRIATETGDNGTVVVSVADTGCGIPPEHVKHIFEPFFTTKPVGVGSGLGLSVSHGIVKAMGGEIRVRSALGKGTVFEVILPGAGARASASAGAAVRRHHPSRILAVNDEPLVLQWLAHTLGKEYDVEPLANAHQALRLIQAGAEFDLIICDVTMSDMSGEAFYGELNAFAAPMRGRLVFLTDASCTAATNAFIASAGIPRLDRPFSSQSVRALVRRLLG